MGIGNMTRRLGMNQPSKKRKTAAEAVKAYEEQQALAGADQEPRERRSSEELVDVTTEIADLVSEFARAEAQLKEAKQYREELKQRAITLAAEHNLDDLVGEAGKVQVVVKKAPVTFDKKLAKTFLSADQWKQCQKTGKVPDPAVKFVPAGERE